MRRPVTQMTQARRPHARAGARTGSRSMTQTTQRPTADALRAHRLERSMLAGWGPAADRLRARWRRARFDGGGGPERPAKNAMEGSQKIFYFLANRAMLTV